MRAPSMDDFIAAKKKERLVAVASFTLHLSGRGRDRDGILHVGRRLAEDGSGFVTLMFLVDVMQHSEAENEVQRLFARLDFAPLLGKTVKTVVKTEVALDTSREMHVQEYTFYVDLLAGRERKVLAALLPALARQLPMALEPLDWLDEADEAPARPTVASRIAGWFRQ